MLPFPYSFRFIYLVIFLITSSISGYGQTTVSGILNGTHTWTSAGSPYIVQGNIYVNGTVIVEPGVEVLFDGPYQIDVNGYFQAKGTAQDSIVFASNDTTGFHLANSNAGGWYGFFFDYYSSYDASDISEFEYCIIRDVKLKWASPNQTAAIASQRGMEIKNCEFYNNCCLQSYGAVVMIMTVGNQRDAIVKDCYFHHNSTGHSCVKLFHNNTGLGRVQDCSFEYNDKGVCIWAAEFPDLLVERNDLDSNYSDQSLGMIQVQACNGRIGDNRVTHNKLFEQAALVCGDGEVLIEKNLICNNKSSADPLLCGLSEGGGGIHLIGSSAFPDSLNKHIVRDNIIANNTSETWGGGIYVYDVDAWIHNNTIVHNGTYTFGPSIYANGSRNIYIHNNLFSGNYSTFGQGGTINHVYISPGLNSFAYDYNYDVHNFTNSVAYSGSNFIGDSTHCLSANNAHMIDPTTSALITEDAATKDFRLSDSSICVNAGTKDSTILMIPVSTFDFGYESRVSGDTIDIGAHEYQFCTDTTLVQTVNTCEPYTWIDGITYTQSNDTASVTLVGSSGCDSTVNLDLTVINIQAEVTIDTSNGTLMATQTGVQYQWLNCENNMAPIPGETGSSFTPLHSGLFAVVVLSGECSDTSDCVEVDKSTGIFTSYPDKALVSVYPNPAQNQITISGSKIITHLSIHDALGRMIMERQIAPATSPTVPLNVSNGIYMLRIIHGDGTTSDVRLIIQQ